MRRLAPLAALLAAACAEPAGPRLSIAWERDMLTISGEGIPPVKVWYLEAYCRSGSTKRDWKQTVIPHKTTKLEESPTSIKLRCDVEGGVEVTHTIDASVPGAVHFDVVAVNRGPAPVDAVWVQPCMRVGDFTGSDQQGYLSRSFIFVDGRPATLDHLPRNEEAIYKGGQVYVPAGIDRADVNPRPLSDVVPSNGLIGCFSKDGTMLLATAWEPSQELFQGVIVCLHSDFRLGGLKPNETKRARGVIYILPNDVPSLLARYQLWRRP